MEDLKDFLLACFVDSENRRNIIIQWQILKPKEQYNRLADYFVVFINNVLFEPLDFHLFKEYFTLFGNKWPIYKRWFLKTNIFSTLHEHGSLLFNDCREYENKQFDFSKPKEQIESSIITREVRRQLIRDFVWILFEQKNPTLWHELIAALQIVLFSKEGKSDRFLSNLERACQSPLRCPIMEIQCWDNSVFDVHTDVKRERLKKLRK